MTPSGTATRSATPGVAARFENAILTFVFALAVLLPIAEIVLRAVWQVGIEGVANMVQHVTLALGMLGAAIAARDGRLLTLALADSLSGRAAQAARWFGATTAAAVSLYLAWASWEFVAIERQADTRLFYEVPAWALQLPLVMGFGLIALRLIGRSTERIGLRIAAAATAGGAGVMLDLVGAAGSEITLAAIAVLVGAAVLGAPIFAVLAGTSAVLLSAEGVPAASLAVNHYSLVTNPTLPAIPMFTLAGYLLAESRAPQRLLEVFDALVGRLRGGAAIVTILACTFFTCFTGASGVAILTLGALVMPLLATAGLKDRDALGFVTAAGLPGIILAPALPLLLYAIVAGVGIEGMFLAGLLPSLLVLLVIVAWGYGRLGKRAPSAASRLDGRRVRAALNAAKWELSLPLVPIVALGTSLATPVEAAAFTAAFAGFIVVVVHRDLSLSRDLPRVVAECGLLVGGILVVLGVALSLTNYLVDAEVPVRMVSWVTEHVSRPWAFLLALNIALLAAGCVMDIFTAIVVLVPLVVPLGEAYGLHPLHLGIVFLMNLEVGYLTPPVGMNLFFSAYRFGRPISEVFRAVLPLFIWLIGVLLIVTYVPWISTFLPDMRQ